MDGISAGLAIAGAFLTLTALAATAFAVFGSSWSKSRNALKDEIISDSKERITQLETNETRLISDRDAERNKRLVLEGIVTGKDEFTVIHTELKGVNKKLDTLIDLQSGKGS